MNKGAVRVIIEAVDRVTAPVRRLGAGLRSMLRGLDLEKVREQIGRVAKGMADVAVAAVAMGAKIVAAGAAAAGALAAITRNVASTTGEHVRAARAVGVSLQSYQQLGHAAALVGSNSDTMGAALGSLRDKALDAARGNAELRQAFRRMGVQIRDSRGELRPTADIMADVADAFARVPASARRTEAAVRLFGDAGAALLPLLDQGSAGLRRAADDARGLGLVLTDAQRDALGGFSAGMARLAGAVQGVQNAIAVRLAPVLTPLINQFTDWIAANRELIATRLEQYIRALPDIIAKVRHEAEALWRRLQPVVSTLAAMVDWLGPLHAGLAALALVMGGGGLAGSLARLVAAIVGPMLGALASMVAAIVGGTGVMAAFNAVLLANPIGAVLLAVALLAGAAVLIYRNWDGIAGWFADLWGAVERLFSGVLTFITGVFTGNWSRAFDGLLEVVAGWADVFWTALSPVTAALGAVARWISSAFGVDLHAAFDRLREAGAGWLSWFGDVLSPVSEALGSVSTWIGGAFAGELRGTFGRLREAGAGWLSWFGEALSPVTDALTAVSDWVRNTFANALRTAFDAIWSLIRPVIDTIAGAIGRIGDGIAAVRGAAAAAGAGVASAAGAVGSGVASAAGAVGRGASEAVGWVGNQLGFGGTTAAPAVPAAGTVAPQRADIGGTVRIRIDQDGRASVERAEPNDRRLRFDAEAGTGRYMEAPG